MAFNIYKWRRDQLLAENTSLSKTQNHPKDVIMNFDFVRLPKRGTGPGSGVDVFSKEEYEKFFDKIPNKVMYTMDSYSVAAQQAIPTFIFPRGEWYTDEELNYGMPGDMERSIDYQIKKDIEKGRTPRLDEIEGDPDDYHGYNEPIDPNTYADDPGYNDKVAFLVQAFQHVWGMGKGNNTIDFVSLAKSTIEDLETRF